jgi:hypothetical protein
MIEAAITGAIAAKIDWALLAGDGAQTGDLDNPLGLINTAGINTQTGTSPITSYDAFVDAIGKVMAFNGVPNAIIGGPGLAVAANKTKTGLTGDNSILMPPPMIVDLEKYYTSQLPNTTAVLGDFSMLAMGLRTQLTLEATRTGGSETFSRARFGEGLPQNGYGRAEALMVHQDHWVAGGRACRSRAAGRACSGSGSWPLRLACGRSESDSRSRLSARR